MKTDDRHCPECATGLLWWVTDYLECDRCGARVEDEPEPGDWEDGCGADRGRTAAARSSGCEAPSLSPLREVIERSQQPNFMLDRLACGHTVADYDNRPATRRRCAKCQQDVEALHPAYGVYDPFPHEEE